MHSRVLMWLRGQELGSGKGELVELCLCDSVCGGGGIATDPKLRQ